MVWVWLSIVALAVVVFVVRFALGVRRNRRFASTQLGEAATAAYVYHGPRAGVPERTDNQDQGGPPAGQGPLPDR